MINLSIFQNGMCKINIYVKLLFLFLCSSFIISFYMNSLFFFLYNLWVWVASSVSLHFYSSVHVVLYMNCYQIWNILWLIILSFFIKKKKSQLVGASARNELVFSWKVESLPRLGLGTINIVPLWKDRYLLEHVSRV